MAVLLRNWLGCIRTQRIYFRKMKSVYLYLYLYSACTYQERLKMTPPPFNGKKGASFLPLPLKNKVSSQLVHPIFVWSSPWKTLLCACSVSDLVECYLQRWSWMPIYRYFMDYVFKIFWFCLFVVIEKNFGEVLHCMYIHVYTFSVLISFKG